MTDLAVLAIGLGVIPLAAILLYSLRGFVLAHREGIWGFLVGVLASVQVDGLTVGATVAHRFVEGCLVVVPAIWGAWKARPAFALLLVSLASVLAAYIPGAVFSAYGGSLRSLVQVAVPTFLAAIEASLGLLLLVRGFLPIAAADRGNRWPSWAAVGFIAISLVHFFVE